MPLTLGSVPLTLKNGQQLDATQEGNNCAWNCICGQQSPLLGTTRPGALDTECPGCKRTYRVLPSPHNGDKATGVQEI